MWHLLAPALVLLLLPATAAGLELWYDFEGDTGGLVTDKLTSDGAQDGLFEANVSIDGSAPLRGAQSALFGVPPPSSPPFSTFEVPGSTALGQAYTIAAHVENLESPPSFTRLFSSFRGTGSVGTDRILVDFDPTGAVIPGIRAIVNNTVVQTPAPPAGMLTPGYHHYAVTASFGLVRIYFDGVEVAGGVVGINYSNSENLRIGEDPHDGGGSIDEQLIGHVDEVLVIARDLPAGDILALATSTVDSVVTPIGTEYAVYYDFEGDFGDQFTADGSQDAIAHHDATIDLEPANAAFGSASGRLEFPTIEPFSRIDLGPVGNLGSEFTLSVHARYPQAGYDAGNLTRLFSSHDGTGSPLGALLFDFDPNASLGPGVRLFLPDGTLAEAPCTTLLNTPHTFTATYDQGHLRIYLDGVHIATADTSGDVDLGGATLYVGEDADGPVNENFIGTLDDAFLIERALTPQEVIQVHQSGAALVIPEPNGTVALLSGAALLAVLRRCARRSA